MSRDQVRATYRVQLHEGFGFDDAAGVTDYLAELGVTHLYCSPYLQARPGSTHGYDVVDQRRISLELGGDAAHVRMLDALERSGMGHVLDVVPNHMTVSERDNDWWWDVLKRGPKSRYAAYFDIDWDPPESKLARKLLIPVLADHYGRVLKSGDVKVEYAEGEWVVRYFEHVLPLDPESTIGLDLGGDLSANQLHMLLERQHYRLAFWRTAGQDLNYRRFFSINDLAALRIENPDVFDEVHECVLSLVKEGKLQGLRIDHIDGLRDPQGYLDQLRAWAPDAYIVVEKILEPGELLRGSWPVEGTTGYDFLNRVLGILVDPGAEEAFTEVYRDFAGEQPDLATLQHDNKMLLMETELAADIERLTELFVQVCESERDYRDFTRIELREAIRETIAAFPVYRTYVSLTGLNVSEQDELYVDTAIAAASARREELDPDLMGFLRDILLLRVESEIAHELALRFQQTTGPVMAKGVEDTLFYVYNRFVALNEVGGDVARFGISLEEFHERNERAQARWPLAMNSTSTHDTKRSEDVRARLAALSTMPEEWAAAVRRWKEINAAHRTGDLPDPNVEYLLYQNLVGAWPIDVERMCAYVAKAAKEAKEHTSWILGNDDYDRALESFVRSAMADPAFMADVERFVEPLVHMGRVNSLAQTLIKLTAPGVPDIYQGCELWDLSLVDPDNRRPVDYDERRSLLAKVKDASAAEVLSDWDAGAPKLYLTYHALRVRAEHPDAFGANATYAPLNVVAYEGDGLVAFARSEKVAVIAPRFGGRGEFKDAYIHVRGPCRNELTGKGYEDSVPLGQVLEDFPVALLVKTL